MRLRLFGQGVLGAALLALAGGCGKSGPANNAVKAPPPYVESAETIARVHWLGKERLGAETNAAYFMGLWHMPEAERLEEQTLEKLAAALCGEPPVAEPKTEEPSTNVDHATTGPSTPNPSPRQTNAAAGRPSTNSIPHSAIRILLGDLVLKESYLELRAVTNGVTELALAVRLSPERATFWQTNLAAALERLTGARPTPSATGTGWELQASSSRPSSPGEARGSFRTSLSRAGDWTLLDIVMAPAADKPSTLNALLSTEFATRIEHNHTPFAPEEAAYWLAVDLDLARLTGLPGLAGAFGLSTIHYPLSTNLPRLSARWIGDGKNVHTAAELEFPRPLDLQLEPWNVPTNLVREPLIGFMAMRGLRPWLASTRWWSELGLGTPPNQAYFWAQHGLQRFHFMALPSAQASNQVAKLGEFVLDKVNPILTNATMKLGRFHSRTNAPGVNWRGFALIWPNLSYTNLGDNPFILASFSAFALTNRPAPDALFQQLYGNPKLVWYDWENTGECAEGLGQLAQMARYMFDQARLTHTAALDWLIKASPKLGPAVTGIAAVGPNRLRLHRTSTIGLTGMELQFFIDWLESPEFPRGLHTFLAKPQPPTAPAPTAQKR